MGYIALTTQDSLSEDNKKKEEERKNKEKSYRLRTNIARSDLSKEEEDGEHGLRDGQFSTGVGFGTGWLTITCTT